MQHQRQKLKYLNIQLGPRIRERVLSGQLLPDDIQSMIGASGGARWMVLSGLDQFLFGHWFRDRTTPLSVIGSSIGTWRFLCAAQADPVSTFQHLESAYIESSATLDRSSSATRVIDQTRGVLVDVIGETGAKQLLEHPYLRAQLLATKCKYISQSDRGWVQLLTVALSQLLNRISRRGLALLYERILFHDPRLTDLAAFDNDFKLTYCPLNENNVVDAVMASSSIPMILPGIRHIDGGPKGVFRDGGILDYHFSEKTINDSGVTLYTHFFPYLVPGWFDKSLSHRHRQAADFDNLMLLSPSQAFINLLPIAKIPDRNDFMRLDTQTRIHFWRTTCDQSRRLADDFAEFIHAPSRYQAALA